MTQTNNNAEQLKIKLSREEIQVTGRLYDFAGKVLTILHQSNPESTTSTVNNAYVWDKYNIIAAARAIGYADHTGTIDEGTRIMDVEDMGAPEPEQENAPTFEDTSRETFAEAYDQGADLDTLAKTIGDQISRTVVEAYGRGEDAAYLLNAIAYHVQGHCNPALSDEK